MSRLTDWKIEIKTHKNAICANNLTLSRPHRQKGNPQNPKLESLLISYTLAKGTLIMVNMKMCIWIDIFRPLNKDRDCILS